MLEPSLQKLRFRLDALRSGEPRRFGFWERALIGFRRPRAMLPLARLTALDRELDQVGVHTSADAALLRELLGAKGRAGQLAGGLASRAAEAMDEYADRLAAAERALAAGAPISGASSALWSAFRALARAAKVADAFAETRSARASAEGKAPFEIFLGPQAEIAPGSAAVEVAAFWAERARTNAVDVVQKRRDLDAAHELLLRAGAEADRDRVRLLRMELSHARASAKEAPATRTMPELLQQLRHQARTDPQAAYRSLRGLYERAVLAGEPALADAAYQALRPLVTSGAALAHAADQPEVALWLHTAPAPQRPDVQGRLTELAFDLDPQRLATFELAMGCARYFDVEDAVSEEVAAPAPIAASVRRVPYPAQQMTFEMTGSLHDVGNFVISDPRLLVYDLASNRQNVRAYLEPRVQVEPRRVRRTAVRVYVLDASGSMHGARARFRDAIMIAELNNLRVKALRGEPFDPVYYSFFNDRLAALHRVDGAQQAAAEIERLFGESPAEGQTQIGAALATAFEQIRAAAGSDPYLSRATVVLVTDGEDRVDVEALKKAQAPVGSVAISLSFISLGEENRDLKALVLQQRAAGNRAFYHHLSDRELAQARTEFDSHFRTLLPQQLEIQPGQLALLEPHLAALEQVALGRAPKAFAASEASFDALFPAVQQERPRVPVPRELQLRVKDILEAISQAAPLAPADQRAQESAGLLTYLLGRYELTVPQYLAVLGADEPGMQAAIERVRLLCRPFG